MNIKIIMGPDRDEKLITVEDGSTIENVAVLMREQHPSEYPYDILIAKRNKSYSELSEALAEGDTIELLDMRNHAADMTYRRGLLGIYLVAIRDVFEARGISGMSAAIETSFNHGIFTRIKATKTASDEAKAIVRRGLSVEDIQAISDRMEEIVKQNAPFIQNVSSREESIDFWKKEGFREKAALLNDSVNEDFPVPYYTLNGYRISYSGMMVPSTGYIRLFELEKYKEGILVRFPSYEIPDRIPEESDDIRLYEAYKEETDWLKLLGTHYVTDMNKVLDSGGAKDLILLSEALHEKKISDIADIIKDKRKRIILIAGPSSSGKTTFARRLCIQLRVNGLKPLYMGTDDYFINREDMIVDEKGERDYESLSAVDIDLFCSDMNALLAGEKVDLPEFDFITGKKVFGKRITQISNKQPIVIEGIHALNGKLTETIEDREKFKIYISPLEQMNIDSHNYISSNDARMLRRMVRDFKYRDRSAAVTIKDWPKVRAGENVNIFPYNSEADVLFNSNLPYEVGYLAKYALPLLKQIKPDEPEYSEAERIMFALQFFSTIEDDSIVPNNSIIREFIGGSVFVE